MTKKPGIEKVIDGVRYYVDGDRMFIADQWDKMFLPSVKKPLMKKNYKGENPDKRNLWLRA